MAQAPLRAEACIVMAAPRARGARAAVRIALARVATATGILRPRGSRGPSVRILCYHRILPLAEKRRTGGQPMIVSVEAFDRQMDRLARRYHPLTIEQVQEHLSRGLGFPERSVLVTFDDGYADNYHHAFPILMRYEVPALVFLATGPIDARSLFWWDAVYHTVDQIARNARIARSATDTLPDLIRPFVREQGTEPPGSFQASERLVRRLNGLHSRDRTRLVEILSSECTRHALEPPTSLSLTWDQVREMTRGRIAMGAHTVNHAFLDELDDAEVLREVEGSVARITEETGIRPDTFSYPRGRYDERSRTFLRQCGIRTAMTTVPGAIRPDSDPLALGRQDAGYLSLDDRFEPALMDFELRGHADHPWLRRRRMGMV